jgi:hypothetical protein
MESVLKTVVRKTCGFESHALRLANFKGAGGDGDQQFGKSIEGALFPLLSPSLREGE